MILTPMGSAHLEMGSYFQNPGILSLCFKKLVFLISQMKQRYLQRAVL